MKHRMHQNKRRHVNTEGPYDRFAVRRRGLMILAPWTVMRANQHGWLAPEYTDNGQPEYVGNNLVFATREEAMRQLAVFALRGDAVRNDP